MRIGRGPRAAAALGVGAAMVALGAVEPARAELREVAPPRLGAGCDDLPLSTLAEALAAERAVLGRGRRVLRFGGRAVPARDYADHTLAPLESLARAGDRAALCAALATRFTWRQTAGPGSVLFTAYHTPTVEGSLSRSATHRHPLYRRPPGAAASYTTRQILDGGLEGRGLELVWLADPYDAFALHVEGSGNIRLPDGKRIAVGTDGQNGHPYQNVSRMLRADGKLDARPAPPAIRPGNPRARRYFEEHPGELRSYWSKNPHFVFFRRVARAGAGRLGPLTAGRSVAIDPTQVPLGAVLLIHTYKPVLADGKVARWEPYMRLVLGQDTGAGIKGPGRIDVYLGDDQEAQLAATVSSVKGSAYVLLGR